MQPCSAPLEPMIMLRATACPGPFGPHAQSCSAFVMLHDHGIAMCAPCAICAGAIRARRFMHGRCGRTSARTAVVPPKQRPQACIVKMVSLIHHFHCPRQAGGGYMRKFLSS